MEGGKGTVETYRVPESGGRGTGYTSRAGHRIHLQGGAPDTPPGRGTGYTYRAEHQIHFQGGAIYCVESLSTMDDGLRYRGQDGTYIDTAGWKDARQGYCWQNRRDCMGYS